MPFRTESRTVVALVLAYIVDAGLRRFFVEVPAGVIVEPDDHVRIELCDDDASTRLVDVFKHV
jgi:hypothetical protein